MILTGNETRHEFFRKRMALDERIEVLATYCEGVEKSLANRIASNTSSSKLESMHVKARTQAELDFFGIALDMMADLSNSNLIPKGAVNNKDIVEEIISINPDVLVCYGSSLIRSALLKVFEGRFLNVHLGLSPYYRGSGTNVWPLINGELDMVGATFMYIDEGIDTGKIIHQIRADVYLGDSPHSIGNRLISKMTETYCDIVARFENLSNEAQPSSEGHLYFQKDFDSVACERLYQNLSTELIRNYKESLDVESLPYIVKNSGLIL